MVRTLLNENGRTFPTYSVELDFAFQSVGPVCVMANYRDIDTRKMLGEQKRSSRHVEKIQNHRYYKVIVFGAG